MFTGAGGFEIGIDKVMNTNRKLFFCTGCTFACPYEVKR